MILYTDKFGNMSFVTVREPTEVDSLGNMSFLFPIPIWGQVYLNSPIIKSMLSRQIIQAWIPPVLPPILGQTYPLNPQLNIAQRQRKSPLGFIKSVPAGRTRRREWMRRLRSGS